MMQPSGSGEPPEKRLAPGAAAPPDVVVDTGLPSIVNVLITVPEEWSQFDRLANAAHPDRTLLALDAEWHEGRLCLVQLAFTTLSASGRGPAGGASAPATTRPPPIHVFTIDCLSASLPPGSVALHLMPVLSDVRLRKLVFDCREDCRMLNEQLGLPTPQGLFDLQLLERLTRPEVGKRPIYNIAGLKAMIREFPSMHRFREAKSSQDLTAIGSSIVFSQRPLSQAVLDYASCDVAALFTLFAELQQRHHFKRNPARVTDDTVRGTIVYATLNAYVPPEFRRHNMLPLGVLSMSKPQGRRQCEGCTRHVASPKFELCIICNAVKSRTARFAPKPTEDPAAAGGSTPPSPAKDDEPPAEASPAAL